MDRKAYRAQSILEYIMAYGWTLIIVAVVIIILDQYGVFNNSTFSSGALPGSCQIVKLSSGVSLSGNCNGQTPKYVASFEQLIGNSSVVGPSGFEMPYRSEGFSEFAWINTIGSTNETVFSFGGNTPYQGVSLQVLGGDRGMLRVDVNNASVTSQLGGLNDGDWHFVGFVYAQNSNEIDMFMDGTWTNDTINGTLNISVAKTFQIGRAQLGSKNSTYYNGQISNIQLYNTTFSSTQTTILYMQGIGAAPESLRSLIGWWPLNGDGNDYSDQNQDGVLNNVTFISDWMNTYTAPQ